MLVVLTKEHLLDDWDRNFNASRPEEFTVIQLHICNIKRSGRVKLDWFSPDGRVKLSSCRRSVLMVCRLWKLTSLTIKVMLQLKLQFWNLIIFCESYWTFCVTFKWMMTMALSFSWVYLLTSGKSYATPTSRNDISSQTRIEEVDIEVAK